MKRFLFFIAGIGLLIACSKSDDFWGSYNHGNKYGHDKDHFYVKGLDQDRYVVMKSTGLKVHYRIIGKGPVDMVFIPGWGTPLEIFMKQFDYFRDKARCIYIDLLGQGLSDAPEGIEYTTGLMADAVYDVLKKEGVHRFAGVGWDGGILYLAQFYKKYPEMLKKVVNLAGGFFPWPTEEPARQNYIDAITAYCEYIETWGEAEWDTFLASRVPDSAPEDLKELLKCVYELPMQQLANIFWNMLQEEVNLPPGWTIPALGIWDGPVDMDKVNMNFPGIVGVHVFEDSGQVVQWVKHETVNQLIWEFVSDRPGRRY